MRRTVAAAAVPAMLGLLLGACAELDSGEPRGGGGGKADAPTGTCEGRCGERSDAGDCFCDDSCELFGDCCGDFAPICLAPPDVDGVVSHTFSGALPGVPGGALCVIYVETPGPDDAPVATGLLRTADQCEGDFPVPRGPDELVGQAVFVPSSELGHIAASPMLDALLELEPASYYVHRGSI